MIQQRVSSNLRFEQINYLWRIVATGICFTFFGLGGLLLCVSWFPLQKVVYSGAERQKAAAKKTVHHTFRFFIGMMKFLGILNLKVEGLDVLKNAKGKIIVANHPSLIDIVVLISLVKNADCVVKAHLFRNPFLRGVIRNTGYISNADPDHMLDDCKHSLDQGNNLIIFPEGTRTTPGQPICFKRGAANIALRSGTPFLPLLIFCYPKTLTKDDKWYHIPKTGKINFEALVLPEYDWTQGKTDITRSKLSRQVTRDLESYYVEKLARYGTIEKRNQRIDYPNSGS
ncbi:MAG: 1-acyl-sn-glycerol-3-phosphate acyltransferase [Pseudomonadales bacterium]|nr:1-acyl-sn-glycerol-3-phosphate acyltransferase [Pseudomonadales bacterium]